MHEELAEVIRERLEFFWKQGIRGADFFISAIGPAVSVFGRYSIVYRLDGSEVGVDALLDLVQAMVSEYALDRIINGSHAQVGLVDAPTRYYILHRWGYGRDKIPFDDAMRLAMALGADVSAMMDRHGVLKQSGENVQLLELKSRAGLDGLGMPDRTGQLATVIDVLHRVIILWERGDREALAEFSGDRRERPPRAGAPGGPNPHQHTLRQRSRTAPVGRFPGGMGFPAGSFKAGAVAVTFSLTDET